MAALLVLLTACTAGDRTELPSERHVISAGYETIVDREALQELADNLDRVDADTVAISAGRADWTTFQWAGHEQRWAGPLAGGGSDPFTEAVDVLGKGREVIAVVDVFVGAHLEEHPDRAARTVDGEEVDHQVSISELTTGEHGDHLVEMVGTLAARDDVDAINITELHYDVGGFGPDDEDLFREDTDLSDWPRDDNGAIDEDDPRIGQWRSMRLAGFVERLGDAVHRHGVELLVDVRAPRDGDLGSTVQYGQDYDALLKGADRLVVWHYVALKGADSSEGDPNRVLAALAANRPDRFIVSLGLWGDDGTMPASQLDDELSRVRENRLASVWITPASMLTDSHWKVLREWWPR